MRHRPGLLVSVEGINGVGKTYLTEKAVGDLTCPVVSLEGFSERASSTRRDLGRDILRALIKDSSGDPFLRGGHPGAETLLLLAIKTYDWEAHCRAAIEAGAVVFEGRSLHTVAVYQALILHPDDDTAAFNEAVAILELAALWRPLPDLVLLVIDEVDTAVARLECRDQTRCDADQRRMHHRADHLYRRLAAADPERIRILDRRSTTADEIVRLMRDLLAAGDLAS